VSRQEVIYRHSSTVRVTHWVNVVALLVLLMSGLQIFNAHPALYLGSKSNFDDPVIAMQPIRHGEEIGGVTTIAGSGASPRLQGGISTPPICSVSPTRQTVATT
jgi:hypothetical protein